MTEEDAMTPGIVSRLPVHHGDGYGWGGDLIVTFGNVSINLGVGRNVTNELAHTIASAPALAEALKPLAILEVPEKPQGNAGFYSIRHSDILAARAALSKATGQESNP